MIPPLPVVSAPPLGWLPAAPGLFAPLPQAQAASAWTLLAALALGALAAPLLDRAALALEKTSPPLTANQLHRWRKAHFYGLTPLLTALAVARFGATPAVLPALLLLGSLLILAWIDAATHLLPDALTLPLLAVGLAVNAAGWRLPWPQALLGAAAGWVLLGLPQLLYRAVTRRSGVGLGDYKLLAALGAWLGAPALVGVVLYASVAAALLGLALVGRRVLAGRPSDWQQRLAFGPLLAAAAALVVLLR